MRKWLSEELWGIFACLSVVGFSVLMMALTGNIEPSKAEQPAQQELPDYFRLDAEGRFVVVPLLIEYTAINSRYLFVFADTQTHQFEFTQSNNAGQVHDPVEIVEEKLTRLFPGFRGWMVQVDPRAMGTAGFCYFGYLINPDGTVWMSASCDQ